MTEAPKFTHNGWMLFCPIKVSEPYSGEPVVAARWLVLEPLLSLAGFVQGLVLTVCSMVSPDYEPQWYFRITGERRNG